ncbi:MAG: dihydrofolate reductase family protein [Nannocystales bacterium]
MPRILEYYVAASVDGYIAREDGSFDAFTPDEEQLQLFLSRIKERYDSVVMGHDTFEVGRQQGVHNPYPWLDTHVFSSRLPAEAASEVSVHGGSAEETVAELRAREGGQIWLCGGGRLAGSLLDAGLVDRVTIKRYPVVFGRGVPLFASTVARSLELLGSNTYDSGVLVSEYAVRR